MITELHLLCDFSRNRVIGVRLEVVEPGVGGPEEVLVLDVDEVLGVADHLDVSLNKILLLWFDLLPEGHRAMDKAFT